MYTKASLISKVLLAVAVGEISIIINVKAANCFHCELQLGLSVELMETKKGHLEFNLGALNLKLFYIFVDIFKKLFCNKIHP